jgi:putative transcriptional regulator
VSAAHTISHHPGEELLVAYGAGASDEALSLLIATHLALCPECRRLVGEIESLGGTLLSGLAPAALADGALQSVLSRLDTPGAAAPAPKAGTDTRVPEPLRSYVGDLSHGWIPVAPGVAHRPFFRRGSTRARLIRGAPGYVVPPHTHSGTEYTLVISGGFSDKTGRYGPGDLQIAGSELVHEPVADPGEDCINLAVTDAPLRFVGAVPKLIGKLFGF